MTEEQVSQDVPVIHELTFSYSTDDDGVYLICQCGWEKNLGFNGTIDDAQEAEEEHDTAVAR